MSSSVSSMFPGALVMCRTYVTKTVPQGKTIGLGNMKSSSNERHFQFHEGPNINAILNDNFKSTSCTLPLAMSRQHNLNLKVSPTPFNPMIEEKFRIHVNIDIIQVHHSYQSV